MLAVSLAANRSNMCCASEVPPIKQVCESLSGVTKVTVNVTSKLTYVYHDYEVLTASTIVDALNYAGFGATLKKDARPKALPPISPQGKTTGKSSFAIANMCCASEVPPILQILEPLPGVTSVKCNVTAKVVYVEHDFTVITADKMANELNKDGFGATVKKAAGKSVAFTPTTEVPVVEEVRMMGWPPSCSSLQGRHNSNRRSLGSLLLFRSPRLRLVLDSQRQTSLSVESYGLPPCSPLRFLPLTTVWIGSQRWPSLSEFIRLL